MEPQTERQLLRNIDCNSLCRYLMPANERVRHGYTKQCCDPIENPEQYTSIAECCVGLDCQMIQTNVGLQVCRVILLKLDEKILYDQWFDIKQGTFVTDYITHITGITQQIYHTKMLGNPHYDEKSRNTIMELIKNKVVVGHDLCNDIQMLLIKHQAFVDSVWLMPHHFGLPFKNKLKDLAFEYLRKFIQWGAHDPFEDSLTALQVVDKHINSGQGTIQIEPFPQKNYNNHYLRIIEDAQLDSKKLLMFVLRGSRALGIAVDAEYKSDWDYIAVYDTQCSLDGRLIKLPNVDISFFDKNSFYRHLDENDISYLEAFFLPEACVFCNKINFPTIDLSKLRASLGFHINKTRMKVKRFQKEQGKNKIYYQWKMLKSYHLSTRFLDLFEQLYYFHQQLQRQKQALAKYNLNSRSMVAEESESQMGSSSMVIQMQNQELKEIESELLKKINIQRMNEVWHDVEKQFKLTHDFEKMVNKLLQIETQKYKQVNELYRVGKRLGHKDQQGGFFAKLSKAERSRKIDKIVQHVDSNEVATLPKSEVETVNFLRTNPVGSLQKYRVLWKRHKVYDNLLQLHYLQSAVFATKIPRQCRGLILDELNDFQVVAYPYDKFFDYNDPKYSQVGEVDWQSAQVYQKKDGSMAFLYFYAGQWNVASSTVPDGQNNYCFAKKETTTEFRNQFWSIFYSLGFKMPSAEDKTKTFIFELMSKNHIIVVKRQKSELCLHGVRDIRTLKQQDHVPYASKYHWSVSTPIKIPAQEMNIQSLVSRVEKLDPLKCEGYVLCDKNWTRVKIKNPSYVRINWLGQLNLGFNKDPKKYILIQIILSGEAETFCKYCPEWEKVVTQFVGKIKQLNRQVAQAYEPIKHLQKREFADRIKDLDKNIQNFLFSVKSNPQRYLGRVETVLSPKNFYFFILNYK